MVSLLRRFPSQIALGALLLYGLTLSHGVTTDSLSLTAKIAGWDWLPLADHPLLWLATLPLRLLPAAWLPAALNLFSALCGAVTLGLLARSLELLPWYRPLATLTGWRGRLPVLLAGSVCGLELNFWQHATNATGEMLDVLLLAAALWLLLEYRVHKEPRWLEAAAVVWGLGMAENWVMLLALPLFLAGVIWLCGWQSLRLNFWLRLAALGAAGFSIYALLPLVNGLLPGSPWSLHQAWLHSLRETKTLLLVIHRQFWVWHRMITLVVLLFYLLPLAALLLRFGNEETQNKSSLDRSLIWIFRGVRAGLLLAGVWLAFDPTLGPRRLLAEQVKVAVPLLSFDYVNALGAGFLAGNLLMMLQPREEIRRRRTLGRQLTAGVERAAVPALTGLLVLAELGLVARNLPVITLANRQPLTQFGELELRSLPAGGGIVVSDFPERLEVFQAAQAYHPDKSDWLAVDTRYLSTPKYRERLNRLHPSDWLADTNGHELRPGEVTHLLDRLAQTNRIFYIHPRFGYFFELFYPQTAGLDYELKRYPANAINPPPLAAETIAQNEKLWDGLAPEIESLQHLGAPVENSLAKFAQKKFHLEPVLPTQIGLLKDWYSLALDDWGVQLQRNGRLPAAQRRFVQALDLNSNNWIARLNLYCNTNLQTGTNMSLAGAGGLAGQIGSPKNLGRVLSYCGPVDEPDGCYILGNIFAQERMPRLALQQFERARVLAPLELAPEFALAELYARCQMNDRAMTNINHLHSELKKLPPNAGLDVQLALLEAGVWLAQTNLNQAVGVLQHVAQQHPDNEAVLNRISEAYFSFGDFTNAEQLATRLLERESNNIPALLIQSGVLLQTRRADLALPVLNHVLTLTNLPQAKFNRAMAYVATTNYAAARTDYLELENSLTNRLPAELALAQLAELQHDTNQAVHYFNLCLSNAPPKSVEWRQVRARLDLLQPTTPDVKK